MTHEPTEDVPYEVDDFATSDDEPDTDTPDQTVETVLIKDLRKYLKEAIVEHSSFDAIHVPANATPEQKIAAFDDMAIHKGLVMHLRNVQQIINNKVKENQHVRYRSRRRF